MKTQELKQLLQLVRNTIHAELLIIYPDINVSFQLGHKFFMNVEEVEKAYSEQGKEELIIIVEWAIFLDHVYKNGRMYGESRLIKFSDKNGTYEYYDNPLAVWEKVNNCITQLKREKVMVTNYINAWEQKEVREVVMHLVQNELKARNITTASISVDTNGNGEQLVIKDRNENIIFKINTREPSTIINI